MVRRLGGGCSPGWSKWRWGVQDDVPHRGGKKPCSRDGGPGWVGIPLVLDAVDLAGTFTSSLFPIPVSTRTRGRGPPRGDSAWPGDPVSSSGANPLLPEGVGVTTPNNPPPRLSLLDPRFQRRGMRMDPILVLRTSLVSGSLMSSLRSGARDVPGPRRPPSCPGFPPAVRPTPAPVGDPTDPIPGSPPGRSPTDAGRGSPSPRGLVQQAEEDPGRGQGIAVGPVTPMDADVVVAG